MGNVKFDDILNTVEKCGNMGGIATEVFFAPASDFKSLASKPDCDEDLRLLPEMNQLSVGKDELLPGKRLYKLYSTMEKGSLQAARQGETDGISHRVNLNLFTPGLEAKSLGMIEVPNMNWIFYVKTGKQMFRVGDSQFPAKLAAEGEVTTGAATADAKGNTMQFYYFDKGSFAEVVDIEAIEAMLTNIDESLTATFTPEQGDTSVLVDATLAISFSEAVINADTLAEPTANELESLISVKSVDINGNYVDDVTFSAAIATNVVNITPDVNFDAATIYEVKFDKSKLISAAEKGRVTGDNFARFITA